MVRARAVPEGSCSTAKRAGTPPPACVDRAQQVAGALGRDHAHIDVLGRHDATEADVEAVGEHQQLARRAGWGRSRCRRAAFWTVSGTAIMMTSAASTASATSMTSRPASLRRWRGSWTPGARPDDDGDAALVEVQRVGVALAAVADDGHGLAVEGRGVGVVVVVHPCGHVWVPSPTRSLSGSWAWPARGRREGWPRGRWRRSHGRGRWCRYGPSP